MSKENKDEIQKLREAAKLYGITTSKTRATKRFLLNALQRVDCFLQYKKEKLKEKESVVSLIEKNELSQELLLDILLYKEIDKNKHSLSDSRVEELKLKGVFFKETFND